MDIKEFRENRKKGLGGTDVAAIMGFVSYKSPYSIYLDKTQTETDEYEPPLIAKIGIELEDFIIKEYLKNYDCKLLVKNKMYFNEKHTWVMANPDAIVEKDGKKYIIDAKTSPFKTEQWGEPETDEFPDKYKIQMIWYMATLKISEAHIYVLFGTTKLERYIIKMHDENKQYFKNYMFPLAQKFWHKHVLAKKKPKMTKRTDITIDYPTHEPDKTYYANNEMCEIIDKLKDVKNQIKILKQEEETMLVKITSSMQDAELLVGKGDEKLATYRGAKNAKNNLTRVFRLK